MPNPERNMPIQGGMDSLSAKPRFSKGQEKARERFMSSPETSAAQIEKAKSEAAAQVEKIDFSKIRKQAEGAVDIRGIQEATINLNVDLVSIEKDIEKMEALPVKDRNVKKLQSLYEDQAQTIEELKIWNARRKVILLKKVRSDLDNLPLSDAERELQDQIKESEAKEERAKIEARRGHELDGHDIPKYEPGKPPELPPRDDRPEYEQADGSWSKEKPVMPEIIESVVDEEGRQVGPDSERTKITARGATSYDAPLPSYDATHPVVSEKKSWIPARLRSWGKKLLLGLALLGGGKAIDQQTDITGKIGAEMHQIDQSIEEAGNTYSKGVQSWAEETPMVRQAKRAEAMAQFEKESAAKRAAAETQKESAGQSSTVETGSSQTTKEMPKMAEQVRKTLDSGRNLPEAYTYASFNNDREIVQHYFRSGASENITQKDAIEALGRMSKFNQEQAKEEIKKATNDKKVADQTIERIFGNSGL